MLKKEEIGKNIKALREVYGETQEEMGDVLFLDKNTISKYELGSIKKFDTDILDSIASHFNIPFDVLVNKDMSDVNLSILVEKNPRTVKFLQIIFPILEPEEKVNNENFYLALKAHKYMMSFEFSEEDFERTVNDICVGYNESHEDSLYALLNYVSMIIYWMSRVKIFIQLESFSKVKSQKLNVYKKINMLSEREKNINFKEITDLIDEVFNMFNVLREKKFESEAVEYFNALLYVFDLIDNDSDNNVIVGYEMMANLKRLKNPYSILYFEAIIELMEGTDSPK